MFCLFFICFFSELHMVRQLSRSSQQRVIQLSLAGKSCRQIGSSLGIHSSTVSRVLKRNQVDQSPSKIGRPAILDKCDQKYISRLATTGKCSTATAISNHLRNNSGMEASPITILRYLNKNNIVPRTKKKKPQLSKSHRRARRDFEKSHRHEWEKIPSETCLKLVRSMPNRLQAIRESKGSYTRY